MFDTTDRLTHDLLAGHVEQKSLPGRCASSETPGVDGRRFAGCRPLARGEDGSDLHADLLRRIVESVESLLPWVSRATGRPVAMWVEGAGLVDSVHEPFPIGTPYVTVCAASWDAAEAVRDRLRSIARIDDARWLAGWRHREPDVKVIRIYPSPSELGIE